MNTQRTSAHLTDSLTIMAGFSSWKMSNILWIGQFSPRKYAIGNKNGPGKILCYKCKSFCRKTANISYFTEKTQQMYHQWMNYSIVYFIHKLRNVFACYSLAKRRNGSHSPPKIWMNYSALSSYLTLLIIHTQKERSISD